MEENNIDLKSIYSKISVENEMLFDEDEENQFLIECIENTFDKKFLLIESNILLSEVNQLNISFVNLIKFCSSKNYRLHHKIFISYCDYFDLPYNKVYLLLHDKLKTAVKNGLIKMIGKKQFTKIDKKINPEQIFTLFDLVSK